VPVTAPTIVPSLVSSPAGVVPHGSRLARVTAACVMERTLRQLRPDAVENALTCRCPVPRHADERSPQGEPSTCLNDGLALLCGVEPRPVAHLWRSLWSPPVGDPDEHFGRWLIPIRKPLGVASHLSSPH
jgi:hypothetical protein